MSEQLSLIVHSSGIDGESLHLPGQGGPNCRTCQPIAYPATLRLDPHAHRDLITTLDLTDQNIGTLNERVATVERILSDLIPLQPGEPGYGASEEESK